MLKNPALTQKDFDEISDCLGFRSIEIDRRLNMKSYKNSFKELRAERRHITAIKTKLKFKAVAALYVAQKNRSDGKLH